ncbi:MAG: WGR domain-containing protein [Xenococcaceae cyanobacterium MO_188.B32]|nr:WGR domain-containing protein [Xenococcaceae cyanobacterium MO_188.B32]
MELVKRITLHYQAGNSDKVYEVDLCRIAEDRYLVNFRYGRRGKSLKEGSKTVQAVALTEAERIFNKLVADKKKKGYWDADNVTSAIVTESKDERENTTITSNNPRHQAIINLLAQQNSENWSLDRVIWRAGELKIREAVPLLVKLISTGEPLRDYCIAWALGKCGDRNAIPFLKPLLKSKSHPEHVNRIAWEALYQLSDDNNREEMRSPKIAVLPIELQELARKGTAKNFAIALTNYLDSQDYKRFTVLDTLYQIDNEYIRPALITLLSHAPLKPNYFKQLRHIFKMAEYRCDGEVFGILAYRFETNKGTFNGQAYHVSLPDGDYINRFYTIDSRGKYQRTKVDQIQAEITSPDSRLAYSIQTREYLRRRIWRTLRTLGEDGGSDYVNLATGVLLQYSDRDAERAKQSSGYRYRYNRETRSYDSHRYSYRWDKYATRIILNHILYENSPRYQFHPQAWRCQGDYKPGDPIPKVREEAFPELWNQQPEALLRLLLESQCLPVHEFAVKAIKENNEYCDRLDIPTLIKLLGTAYEITVELAFNLVSDRYNPQQPDGELVLAVTNCILSTARERAYQWIEAQREYFLESSDFIAGLVTSLQADTRAFARKLLSSSILSESTARVLIARIIAALLALDENQTEMAQEVSETLLLSFTPQLRTLGFNVILDLLDHPLPEIQVLGARILLNHQTPATELPSDLIESLLSSPHDSVRSVGIRIFGQLPDERLMSDRIFIIAMVVNSSSDIRHAIRPVIRRLAENQREFALEIAIDFIDLLTEPERHEGVHKDLVELLQQELSDWMSNIATDKIMSLIRAKSPVAQELGGIVLQANSDRLWSEFSTSQLVGFANNEILAIRQAAWRMLELKLDSIRHDEDEMLFAIKLMESKWEDSQEFARSLFDRLDDADWTPKLIIGVCDSTKEDVRRFGRDKVTSNFKQEYGQEYLLKFSEHPSGDMQMFVTNYLETYAVNDEERLSKLVPYFVTVLSGVNKGSVAKKRIFSFLDKEAAKSEAAARVVAEVLTRQSVTMAIGDKAEAIQIMLRIKRKYPEVELPIRVKEVVAMR